jgi:hypothetical protein
MSEVVRFGTRAVPPPGPLVNVVLQVLIDRLLHPKVKFAGRRVKVH